MRLETIFPPCYAYGMENLPEIELLGSRQWHRETPPGTFFAPGNATYQLLFIASGLRRGRLHLPDGRNPYRVPPQGAEGLLLLVPPGADFTGVFAAEETEARVFSFRCPTLRPDEIRPRCLFTGPEGTVQAVKGTGADARIMIAFTAYGTKEFSLSIAPIVKIEE